MFHVIDSIIADNAVEDVEGQLAEVRVKINNLHGKDGGQDFREITPKQNRADPKQVVPNYLEASSEAGGGFPGLLPPLA